MAIDFNDINGLNPILAADVEPLVDTLPIADASTGEAKKVTASDVVEAGLTTVPNDSVQGAKLADGTVPGSKLVADSVTAAQIAPGAIGTSELADVSVTAAKIAANTITANEIGINAIGSSELANGAVDTAAIQDGNVTASKLAIDSVGTTKIVNAAVTSAKIAIDAIGTGQIVNSAVTADKIGPLAVESSKIAASAVTVSKIADLAVGSGKIADLAVTTSKLADAAVTAAKLDVSSVGTAAIVDLSVTAEKLGVGSVENTKIAAAAVTASKIAAGQVATAALADGGVTTAKVAPAAITADKIAGGLGADVFAPQAANVVLAGPATGVDAVPTFRALTSDDLPVITSANLPIATNADLGGVIVGGGLTVDAGGIISIGNSITGGTFTKVTVGGYGLVLSGGNLIEADIPALDASKIATGTFGPTRIADDAVTPPKVADYATAYIQEVEPVAVYIGQMWYQESTGQMRIWNGNSWMPVGFGKLSQENLRFCGLVDASTGLITTLTKFGIEAGLTAGADVPPASDHYSGVYLVVEVAGSAILETPGVTYDNGDWCLCIDAAGGWTRIDT